MDNVYKLEVYVDGIVLYGFFRSKTKAQAAVRKIRRVTGDTSKNDRRVVIKHDAGVMDIDIPYIRGVSYVGIADKKALDSLLPRENDNG